MRPTRSESRPAGPTASAPATRKTAGPRPRMLFTPVTATIVTVPSATASWIIPERKTSPPARKTELRAAGLRAGTKAGRSMNPLIELRTLTDGGQPATEVAHAVADFLEGAKRSLDLAQYDFNLGPETGTIVGDAIRRAAARGVRVR